MRRTLQLAMFCLCCAGALNAQVVVDRIVATVNGQPILQSDWDIAMRCEAFLDQKPLQFTPQAASATLERLVDQELLRQQVRSFQLKPIEDQQLRARMQEIRKQIPGTDSDAGWQAALNRYGLTQSELEERIADELQILRFIDVRFRPTVHVDRRKIEAYYREKLLPQLKEKGAKEVPLAEVSPQIEEILSQQETDALVSDMLRELRQQSEIRLLPAAVPGSAPPPQEATQTDKGAQLSTNKCAACTAEAR